MRKPLLLVRKPLLLALLIALAVTLLFALLTGFDFGAKPAPTPTPRPTATPTPAPRYYPTVLPETRQILMLAFDGYEKQPVYQEVNGEKSLVIWPLVSTGKFETFVLEDGEVEVDVVWVIFHAGGISATKFPYVYGIWFAKEKSYFFFINEAFAYGPKPYDRAKAQEEIQKLLPRGIPFLVRIGRYVSKDGINWDDCDANKLVCDFGSRYNDLYGEMTNYFIRKLEYQIPEGWFLFGWLFDNLGANVRIDIPTQEVIP